MRGIMKNNNLWQLKNFMIFQIGLCLKYMRTSIILNQDYILNIY